MATFTAQSDPILADIVERLVEAFESDRVSLFGSKARGDDGLDSDCDLMVIVPDDASTDRRRSALAYERLWGTGEAADVVVWTRRRFDRRSRVVCPFPATAVREGKLPYAS